MFRLPARFRRAPILLLILLCANAAHAQRINEPVGGITGTVTSEANGLPIAGVHVFLESTALGAVTDDRGRFNVEAVPPGRFIMVARYVGYESERLTVDVLHDTTEVHVTLTPSTEEMEEIVVTAIGERQTRSDVAATVQTIERETIERIRPVHPSDVMNRLPGVWVNTTSGEGHMTSIRQPLSTDPVYLYLENGVPIRSSAFFDHNALYELNVPMAADVEVMKGPGSALYGSEAIGGVINVSTPRPPIAPMARVAMEGGSFGYGRLMLSSGAQMGNYGLRLDMHAAKSDGWRDASSYDRQSGTLTLYSRLKGPSSFTTVASFSIVDQEPAGASALSLEDFERSPRRNYTPISYRDVLSLRVSSAYERLTPSGAITVTPFARFNRTKMLPNWSLSYDPAVGTSHHGSVGLLARYRHDFDRLGLRLIAGTDLEASPGDYTERVATPTKEGPVFTDFREGVFTYRYDVTFTEFAPYVHAEYELLDRLRLTAGLRTDVLSYTYDNSLQVETRGLHRRAPDTQIKYTHLSPKLGATFRLGPASSAFVAYRHAFRVPSESQIFRQGSTTNTLGLEPVKADNLEVGLRLLPFDRLGLELSVYHLQKTDDIITFIDDAGELASTNAGKTSHRGVEAGLQVRPLDGLQLTGSYSYALHRYVEWQRSADADYSGNEIDLAPRSIGFAEVLYRPSFAPNLTLSVEANYVGSYWMDPENTHRYSGHTAYALRGSVDLPAGLTAFGRVTNLRDELYAEQATYDALYGSELAPAQPRAFYFGLRYGIRAERAR